MLRNAVQKICGGNKRSATNTQKLPVLQKISYGVGHVFNDLCANCWFSYLLLYMTKVVSLSNASAGLVLLIGQVADAIFTPFIGYGCDKTNCKCYGRRKLWHLIGSLCVLLSFPFIFNLCLKCDSSSPTILLLYYSSFVVVFQFGWAAVQISHLSLIPEICHKVSEKVELNAIRSGLTFVCGIYVFGATWFLLGTNPEENVTKNVAPQFMYLSFIVVGTGLVFSLLFHVGTKEPTHYICKKKPTCKTAVKSSLLNSQSSSDEKEIHQNGTTDGVPSIIVTANSIEENVNAEELLLDANSAQEEKCRSWKEWLKTPFFYKMALIYMCTRLTLNVSSSYFVLYLTETMEFEKEAIAYFPLLVLVSGVISSVITKISTKRLGGRLTFVLGCLAALGSFIWLFMATKESRKSVYVAALLMGGGCSVMLVTSLAMTADLIGSHKGSCAFVYSAMSFTDKLSSGIVIYIIQQLKPTTNSGLFTKYVQTTVTGASCLIGLICVIFFFPPDFTWKRKVYQQDVATQTQEDEELDGGSSKSASKRSSKISMEPDGSLEVPRTNLTNGDAIDELAPNGFSEEDLIREMDTPSSVDEKLRKLSGHSSVTSYIAWRLASPHIPSPGVSPVLSRRNCCQEEAVAV